MRIEMNWFCDQLKLPCLTFFVVISFIVSACSQSQEAARSTIAEEEEPIFSSFYDGSAVHFGEIQTRELLPECEKLLSNISPLPKSLTLYAQYKAPSSRMYIVGSNKTFGIYVITGGGCDAGVPILALLKRYHNPPIPSDGPFLSDSEVKGLFGDALVRYAKAFGGKQKFLQWLDPLTEQARNSCKGQPDSTCPPTQVEFQPALQEELERFRKL